MKKILTVLILCMGLLTGTITNANSFKTVQDSNIVIYSDTIAPDTIGICFIVKKGGSIDDNESVYMLKNSVSDSKGNIGFEFNMSEKKNGKSTDGEYDIYLKEENGEVKKSTMTFSTSSSRNGFLEKLEGVSSEAEFKDILGTEENKVIIKSMGGKADLYSDEVAELIYGLTNVTQDKFVEAYNTAVAVCGLKKAEEDEAGAFLEVLNPEFENVNYNDIEDEKLIKWIDSYMCGKKFSIEAYKTANILYKFNTSVSDKIDDLLEKYADKLAIEDKSEYEDYKELKNKSKVNIEIAKILEKSPAKSADDLLDAIGDAINEVSSSQKSSSLGGGGGYSSKTNGYVTGVPSASEPKKEESTAAEKFADMKQAEWAKEAVSAMADLGIVSGDENGNFRPNDAVTREEFVKMLVLASGKYNKDAVCSFEDVSKNVWYYSYVASAYENGIANGISKNRFGTGYLLTRQDMAVLCARIKSDIRKIRDNVGFADGGEIADYAKDAVSKLYIAGIINGMGDNKFAPLGQATRAQSAQMIYNLFVR